MQLLTNKIDFIANFTRANVCMDREIFKGGLVTGTLGQSNLKLSNFSGEQLKFLLSLSDNESFQFLKKINIFLKISKWSKKQIISFFSYIKTEDELFTLVWFLPLVQLP